MKNSPRACLLVLIMLCGWSHADVVVVTGERTFGTGDSRGKGIDYIVVDEPVFTFLKGQAGLGSLCNSRGEAVLPEGFYLNDVENILGDRSAPFTVITYDNSGEEIKNSSGAPVRRNISIWSCDKASEEECWKHLSKAGFLMAEMARTKPKGAWQDILAGGALIATLLSGDIYTQLHARSLLQGSSFAVYDKPDGASLPVDIPILVSVRCKTGGSSMTFMNASLLQQVCGTDCLLMINSSKTFGLACTWVHTEELDKRLETAKASYFKAEMTTHTSVGGKVKVLGRVRATNLWLSKNVGKSPQFFWGSIIGMCRELQATASSVGHTIAANKFSAWAESANTTALRLASKGISRLQPAGAGAGAGAEYGSSKGRGRGKKSLISRFASRFFRKGRKSQQSDLEEPLLADGDGDGAASMRSGKSSASSASLMSPAKDGNSPPTVV